MCIHSYLRGNEGMKNFRLEMFSSRPYRTRFRWDGLSSVLNVYA